jgi:hypothetical protein
MDEIWLKFVHIQLQNDKFKDKIENVKKHIFIISNLKFSILNLSFWS